MVRKRFVQTLLTLFAIVVAAVLPQAPAFAVGEVYGPYFLVDMKSDKCIDNPKSSEANNTVMIIYDCTGGRNQQWFNKTPVTNNDYWTYNAYSIRCLTVQNQSMGNNAAIIQYTCNNGANERWVYRRVDPGFLHVRTIAGKTYYTEYVFQIVNLNSGLCLTVKNQSILSNTTLLQYDCNSPGSNKWAQFAV